MLSVQAQNVAFVKNFHKIPLFWGGEGFPNRVILMFRILSVLIQTYLTEWVAFPTSSLVESGPVVTQFLFTHSTSPALINASPVSMGLLSKRGPPAWHPATQDIKWILVVDWLLNWSSLGFVAKTWHIHNVSIHSNVCASVWTTTASKGFSPCILGLAQKTHFYTSRFSLGQMMAESILQYQSIK